MITRASLAARTILYVACAIMRTGKEYDDGRVNVPAKPDDRRRARRRPPLIVKRGLAIRHTRPITAIFILTR